MSLNSSSSSSNSSQTQLVAAADQPHPPIRNSTSSLKDSPILRSLSRKSQKFQASRQENIPDSFEPTSVISVEDTCVVDRVSHSITVHKPLNDPPKEESMDYNIQQQPKELLGRSDSERSLMDEGAPVCSCDQQPLHSDREAENVGQADKLQDSEDMDTNQDYDKSAADATATVKKRILEEANKSVCACVLCLCHVCRFLICLTI